MIIRVTLLVSSITPITLPRLVFTLLILRAKRACKIASTVTKKFSLANVQNPLMIIIQYSWYGQSLPHIIKTTQHVHTTSVKVCWVYRNIKFFCRKKKIGKFMSETISAQIHFRYPFMYPCSTIELI
ncbi:hypothetical protein CWN56_06850 [Klebsiella pneumoniae]|nr:hypothetical protein CWN56_06850 [Klebsiella pneumoniae]